MPINYKKKIEFSTKYFIILNPEIILFRLIHKQTLFLQTNLILLNMKKLAIILLVTIVWLGVEAKTKMMVSNDSTQTEVSIDSLQKLYMSDKLDPKEAILLQKLTPEQIMKLEEDRLANEKINDMPFSSAGLLMISALPFIMVVLIVYFSTRNKNKESIRKHELYLKALEAGQTIPENYFKSPEKYQSSNLQRGAVWLGVGLALVIAGVAMHKELFFLGMIPAFVGLAYLLVYFVENKKNKPEDK